MAGSKRAFAALIGFAAFAVACQVSFKSGSDSGGGDGNKTGDPGQQPHANRVIWQEVPADYHPKIEETRFQTNGIERIETDVTVRGDEPEVVYENIAAGTGVMRLYTVWDKSASWLTYTPYSSGKTLQISGQGVNQCSIRISNGHIVALEGGCYVRLQVVLPPGSEIEVYNQHKLISKRFIPIDAETLIANVDHASFSKEKFIAIDEYLNSYQGTSKTPTLTSSQLGRVIHQFIPSDDKKQALRKLHAIVSDRQNLGEIIKDEFVSPFDQEEARKIVGI